LLRAPSTRRAEWKTVESEKGNLYSKIRQPGDRQRYFERATNNHDHERQKNNCFQEVRRAREAADCLMGEMRVATTPTDAEGLLMTVIITAQGYETRAEFLDQ
jgi:hypothetical protein